jgi:hypothetical protein
MLLKERHSQTFILHFEFFIPYSVNVLKIKTVGSHRNKSIFHYKELNNGFHAGQVKAFGFNNICHSELWKR